MVVPLGPGKFYGSSLPRPRFYTDIKFNSERVDPPVAVLDPLLSWANEAHWSMGGLSFNRLRLQGRIEGNVQKLRAQREKTLSEKEPTVEKNNRAASLSPPPAPMAVKRRRFLNLIDDSEDDFASENEGNETPVKRVLRKDSVRKLIRKLEDDFERVANGKDHGVLSKGKRCFSDVESDEEPVKKTKKVLKGLKKNKDKLQSGTGTGTGTRSSPRLAKRNL